MKKINDVCVLVLARLGSQRVPGKMIKPFADTTLIDILFDKLKSSKQIPLENIYFSAYEPELKEIANKHGINIFHRSESSAKSEGDPLWEIYEWWNKLPFKYVIKVNACSPLLKIETIDAFISEFINQPEDNLFGVISMKDYFWNNSCISCMSSRHLFPVYFLSIMILQLYEKNRFLIVLLFQMLSLNFIYFFNQQIF